MAIVGELGSRRMAWRDRSSSILVDLDVLISQSYDSAFLRWSSGLLAIPLVLHERWPIKLRPYLPLYVHFYLSYMLPFLFTYLALRTDFSLVSVLSLLGGMFFVGIFIRDAVLFLLITLTGTVAGIGLYLINFGLPLPPSFPAEFLPIYLFCVVAMLVALHNVYKQQRAAQAAKDRELIAISGTIAHEVRKPVSQAK